MAITSSIDAAARIVLLNYTEEVSPQEWRAVMLAICQEPTYHPGYGFLVDRRRVGAPTRECVNQVLGIVGTRRETLAAGPWALVVGNSQSAFGMGRMLSILAEELPMRIEVFRDIDVADRWLRAAIT